MRFILLGLLVVVGAFGTPAAALGQPSSQQAADDYQLRLLVWQQLVEREVGMLAGTILDESRWPDDVATRVEWAAQLSDLVGIVGRPAPGWEQVYRLQVQPINDRLEGLAAALRVNRRDSGTATLAALRSTLATPASSGAASGDTASGESPLQPPPVSGEAAVDAAIFASQANCMAQAYVLGWRWESPLPPEGFLRQYWTQWLQRTGADPTPAQQSDLSCDALYQQAQQVARDSGFAVAQQGGVITPPVTTTVSGQTDRGLAQRGYRLLVADTKAWLADSMTCFLRSVRPGLTTFRIGPDCQTVFDELGTATESCAGTLAAFRLCLVGKWRDTYRAAARWSPPPEYRAFHSQLLGVLTLLSQAADNITYTANFQAPQGGTQLTAAQRAQYLRDARLLVGTAREQCFGILLPEGGGPLCEEAGEP